MAANEYKTASELIKKGASVDAVRVSTKSKLFIFQGLANECIGVPRAKSQASLPITQPRNWLHKFSYSWVNSFSLPYYQFQPGAVEGTVEVTPLSQAAGKGLDDMVTLLLNNGANINYLCSVRFSTSSLCMWACISLGHTASNCIRNPWWPHWDIPPAPEKPKPRQDTGWGMQVIHIS